MTPRRDPEKNKARWYLVEVHVLKNKTGKIKRKIDR